VNFAQIIRAGLIGLACASPLPTAADSAGAGSTADGISRKPPDVPEDRRGCVGVHLAGLDLFHKEWMRLGGPAGPMGCPTKSNITDSGGGLITFQNGQIAVSPHVWERGVLAAYQDFDWIVVDWTVSWDEPFPSSHFNYDEFLLRWDFNGEHFDGDQWDIRAELGGNRIIKTEFEKNTHLRTKGTQRIPARNDIPGEDTLHGHGPGNYRITVEGCDLKGLKGSKCRQGWLWPVTVEYKEPAPNRYVPIDLSKIAPATSVQTSKATFDDRLAAVVLANACGSFLPHTAYVNEENYSVQILAKMAYADFFDSDQCPGRDVKNRDEVAASLLRQHVESKSGTTKNTFPWRTGEYDVFLTLGLIPVIFKYGEALPKHVRDHVINELLNIRGPFDPDETHVLFDLPGSTKIPETENHILNIETSRYLTNQLLFSLTSDKVYDNSTNGMDALMLDMLRNFLRVDFREYNSRPYQGYVAAALQNLFSFTTHTGDAPDSTLAVRTAAQMVLDYISAKITVSSNSARRAVPYRRKREYKAPEFIEGGHPDPQTPRLLMLAGNTEVLSEAFGERPSQRWAPNSFGFEMQAAGLSDYRIPDLLLDLIVNKDHRTFYQGFHHAADELYASSPALLLSAGVRRSR
jgi:hypothetical protein